MTTSGYEVLGIAAVAGLGAEGPEAGDCAVTEFGTLDTNLCVSKSGTHNADLVACPPVILLADGRSREMANYFVVPIHKSLDNASHGEGVSSEFIVAGTRVVIKVGTKFGDARAAIGLGMAGTSIVLRVSVGGVLKATALDALSTKSDTTGKTLGTALADSIKEDSAECACEEIGGRGVDATPERLGVFKVHEIPPKSAVLGGIVASAGTLADFASTDTIES